MKLAVKERLILMSVIPQEGNFITLKVIRKLKEDLSFSEEEHKQYNFAQNEQDNTVTWDDKVEQVKEIEFGEKANEIIVEALKGLDRQKKLKDEHFSLYERFVKQEGDD